MYRVSDTVFIEPIGEVEKLKSLQETTDGMDSQLTPTTMKSTGILLHHEDSIIRVVVNGVEKFLAKEWLTGEGRAANTILSKQILGTEEGLQGTSTLTLDEKLFPFFDLVVDWLSNGNDHTRPILSNQNTSQLNDLALYFGLDGLLNAIQHEKQQRIESFTQRATDAEGLATKFERGAAALERAAAGLERNVAEGYRDTAQRVRGRAQHYRDTAQRNRRTALRIRDNFPSEFTPSKDHSSV